MVHLINNIHMYIKFQNTDGNSRTKFLSGLLSKNSHNQSSSEKTSCLVH